EIRQSEIDSEFLVLSQKNNTDLFYTVNVEICAVAAKYNIGSLNFYQSLMPYDHAIFAYIASGLLSNDHSFYASLHACTNNKPEDLRYKMQLNNVSQESNKIWETEILDVNSTTLEHNSASFNSFLEIIKHDYENCTKAKSVPALTSFLYDINRNVDPLARVKSGAKIRVQVKSIKRRKTSNNDKENIDQYIISARKVRAKDKKAHNI
ncbi:29157_t:CDS:2, partial [Racocetra persica]